MERLAQYYSLKQPNIKRLQLSTLYSQRDTRWAATFLGTNTQLPFNIGAYGCLITTLAMYLTAIGKVETPNTLNDKLRANDGFINGGFLIWGILNRIYPDLTIMYQSPKWQDKPMTPQGSTKLRALIDDGYFPVCELDFNPVTDNEEMHWVGVVGYDDTTFYIADPWTGKIIDINTYGGATRSIISYTAFNIPLEIEDTSMIHSDNTSSLNTMTLSDVEYANMLTKCLQWDKVAKRFMIDPLDKLGGDRIVLIINELDKKFSQLEEEKRLLTIQVTAEKDIQVKEVKVIDDGALTELHKKLEDKEGTIKSLQDQISTESIDLKKIRIELEKVANIKIGGVSLLQKIGELLFKTISIKWEK